MRSAGMAFETGPVLALQKIPDPFLAPGIVLTLHQLEFLRHGIVHGGVPAHLERVAIALLGRAQGVAVLARDLAGDRHRLLDQPRFREGPVDEADAGGLGAVEGVTGHAVVKSLARPQQVGERFRHAAAGKQLEVDLGEPERRLLRREGEVAAFDDRERAAEAEAVDHGDDRLGVIAVSYTHLDVYKRQRLASDFDTQPPGNSLKLISESPNVASSAAKARSQPSTIENAPPKQKPLTMAMIGLG